MKKRLTIANPSKIIGRYPKVFIDDVQEHHSHYAFLCRAPELAKGVPHNYTRVELYRFPSPNAVVTAYGFLINGEYYQLSTPDWIKNMDNMVYSIGEVFDMLQ